MVQKRFYITLLVVYNNKMIQNMLIVYIIEMQMALVAHAHSFENRCRYNEILVADRSWTVRAVTGVRVRSQNWKRQRGRDRPLCCDIRYGSTGFGYGYWAMSSADGVPSFSTWRVAVAAGVIITSDQFASVWHRRKWHREGDRSFNRNPATMQISRPDAQS